jgi:hypothetical protein
MIEIYVSIPASLLETIEANYESRILSGVEEGESCRISKEIALGGSWVQRKLDTYNNISTLITRSIADIREPQARSSEWTKTFEIPGSKTNNIIFSHLFEVEQTIESNVQFVYDYNPNLKADIILYSDGIEQLRGFLRLLSIRVDDSTHIVYEVTLHGQTADLFTTLSERKLNALDFSEYNHTLSSGNVIDSWATQIYKNGSTQAFTYGEGYMYAMIDKGHPRNISLWETNEFTPCLYAKTIVDKMFANASYTYTNDSFFNSDRFKRLVIPPPSSLTIDADLLESRRFKASRITSPQLLDLSSTLIFQNDSTSGNYDNGGNYNNTTGQFTAPVGGNYVFDVLLGINYNSTGYMPIFQEDIWLVFGLYVNGVKRTTSTITVDFGAPTFNIDLYFSPSTLLNGDIVEIKLVQVYDNANSYNLTNSEFQLDISTNSYIENNLTAFTYGYGETVDFAVFMNSEVKQSELLLSFVKMFNLYIEPNQDNPKELRIVPRDEFYNGAQVDWTKKLDYSQSVEIVPMGELEANPYKFQYKEGKDDANVLYQESYQTTYGSRTYQVENQFVKEEKKIEVVFSPTQIRSYNNQKNFVLSFVPNPQDGDLRVMYYSGLVSGVNWMLYAQYAGVGVNRSNRFSIPITTHLDDIANPTFDINFGMPREIGLGAGYKYTNSNLVNNYYYRFLTEITSKNSKILRAHFRITTKDYLNLSFSDAFFFEGQYWRLNKIEDYDPNGDSVYLCEFLLAQFVQPATIAQKTIGAGTGQGQQGETYGDIYPGGSIPFKPGIKGVSVGTSNGGSGVFVGDGIVQSSNNDNSSAFASVNTSFLEGADNSIAVVCDDFAVEKPNTMYVGNYEMYPNFLSGGAVRNVSTNYNATKDDWLILADTSAGNLTITLPDPTSLSGKTWIIKKPQSGHRVTIDTATSAQIDGSDSHTQTSHHSYDVITTDGVQFYIIAEGH